MVTIEQKLEMFSRLLHRSMNDKFTEDMENLKKEYEEKIQKNKEAVDKAAEGIISKSRKKAEAEKTEMISKIRIRMKKEYMSVKEEQYESLMSQLKERIEQFIQSERYGAYLLSLLKKAEESGQLSDDLLFYMTKRDHDQYMENIKQELAKLQYKEPSVKIAEDNIIGGFIIEDHIRNVRMDFSARSLLEDNRLYIMQTLFQAIEAGEMNGI